MTFFTVCGYNGSTLLLLTVFHLFLGLIYKLNFIIGVCMGKNVPIACVGFGTVCSFRHPSWNVVLWIWGERLHPKGQLDKF